MNAREAIRLADALVSVTDIRRSSALTERVLLDGVTWSDTVDDLHSIEESTYSWLPITLLAISAHGGAEPTGAATQRWRDAEHRLRHARIANCETIAVQLMDADEIVAEAEPWAEWLPGDVLAIRRDLDMQHEKLAAAAQAILDRQDLLKDLRLVLGPLSGQEIPTFDQIAGALERAEIDAQALADIQNRWAGAVSFVVDRIRPVLVLLDSHLDSFDVAASNIDTLTEWLVSHVPQWPASDLLSAARSSRDDREMGLRTWQALGDVAQLPAWNAALATLGERFEMVENRSAQDQTATLIDIAAPLLRCLARHIAIEESNPDLFSALESVTQDFKVQPDWPIQWWDVPFTAVIAALHAGYGVIPSTAHHLEVLERAQNVDDLRAAFQDAGIETNCNPYELARRNSNGLDNMLPRTP